MRKDAAKKRGERWYNEWDMGWLENTAMVLGTAP